MMDREILFRGKRLDNGEWVDGYLIRGARTYIVSSDDVGYMVVSLSGMASVQLYPVDPSTVGQYTGLTDKNGVKIFEGDIIRSDDFGHTFVVAFGRCGGERNCKYYGYFGFYLAPYDGETKDFARYGLRNDICYWVKEYAAEIVGNIHDNLELAECKVIAEWISVKDRLPSDDEDVLMIVSGKPTENITLIGVYEVGSYSDEVGWVVDEYPEWDNPDVLYWMPIPEPPEEARS